MAQIRLHNPKIHKSRSVEVLGICGQRNKKVEHDGAPWDQRWRGCLSERQSKDGREAPTELCK